MNQQIMQIDNIYDLFALLSSYILDRIQEDSYVFDDFKDDDYNDVYDSIEKYVNDKEGKGHKYAFYILRRYVIRFLGNDFNIEKCFAIVKFIDELVECEIQENLFRYEDFVKYNTISKKYEQEVRIIPKVKNTILLNEGEFILKDPTNPERDLLRSTGECFCSILDEKTVNYMIWDKDKINRFPLSIYRPSKSSAIRKHFLYRRKLTIGLVPFTCEEIDDILDITYSEGTFFVNGMKDDAKRVLQKRYIDIYRRSHLKDIDFLIFPEMLMTEDIIQSIQEEPKRDGEPKFIVNGSIWENYTNKSIITDGKGNQLFAYYKKNPYTKRKNGKKYKERLKKCDRAEEYAVIEIEGIGRVGLCICKDLMHEDILMFHKYIKTDLLLVPAFSDSIKPKTDAKTLAEKYNCFTIFANACAAYKEHWNEEEQKNIGFLSIPAKEKNSNDCYVRVYCADACERTCEQRCIGKLFTLSFADISSYETKFSININETVF